MNQENKQPETVDQAAAKFAESDEWSGDMNIYAGLYNGFVAGANWQKGHSYTEQAPKSINDRLLHHITDEELLTAMENYHRAQSTYTQEQMLAFGEAVLKSAATIAENNSLADKYSWVCKGDILNIDISKLLKK